MKNLLTAVYLLAVASPLVGATDPAAELAGFSVFNNVDINELASGDAKTAHGPPMNGRYLSVQSVFVVPGPPSQVANAMKNWDPTRHRELKVYLHHDLPAAPSASDFSKLESVSAGKSLVEKAQKNADDVQVGKDEAAKLAGGAAAWGEILAARTKSFASGGSAAEPAFNLGNESIKPNEEINSLLKAQDKIRKQFAGFLGETGIGRGGGSLKPELYWEIVDVDDQGVVTLGASYDRASNGGYQAAEVLYYASGGYYVTLTLVQLWPVTANGKPSTLVWRGDLVSSAALAELHGVERLGSESAMMKDIGKQVSAFRKDIGR